MSKSLIFGQKMSKSLIFGQKTSNLLGNQMSEFPALHTICKIILKAQFYPPTFFVYKQPYQQQTRSPEQV